MLYVKQIIKKPSITAKLNVCEYEENCTTICLKENIAKTYLVCIMSFVATLTKLKNKTILFLLLSAIHE